jgi:hypothetical protein
MATATAPATIEINPTLSPIEQYTQLLDAIEAADRNPKSIHTADPLTAYHEQIVASIATFKDLPFLTTVERRGEHFAMYHAANPAHLRDVLILAGWPYGETVSDRYGERFKEYKTNRSGAGLEESRHKDTIGSVISISVQGSVVALGTRAVSVLDQIVAQQQGGTTPC